MDDGPVREGDVLAGKYRVERVLGAGGMGVVVAAWHLQLEERVALKFLLPGFAGNSEVVARFAREARSAAKIKSEHVARVTDVGTLDGGAPYLVMEFLSGVDLAAVIKQRGVLAIEDAVEYVLQASEALGEAHSLGIVHRDLKPGNLFLAKRHDGSPCVKVLDFGISKVVGATGSSDHAMTATHAMLGSPLYMSPEQMLSAKNVDHRSDVWALGVILYELLTGTPPFQGDSIAELALRVTRESPRPMRDLRPDLPPALERVVLRCLEKDPGKRVQNVGELAVALAEFGPKRARISVERVSRMMRDAGMSASQLALPPSSDADTEPQAASAVTDGAWGKTRTGSGSSRSWVTMGAVAVAAAGAVAWMLLRTETPPASTVSEPAVTATSVESPAAAAPVPVPVPAVVVEPSLPPVSSGDRVSPPIRPAEASSAPSEIPRRAAKPRTLPSVPGPPPAASAPPKKPPVVVRSTEDSDLEGRF